MIWTFWIIMAILAIPVTSFLAGFTYGIIERIYKSISKIFKPPVPVISQPLAQPVQTIPVQVPQFSDPFAPYNRIRGYFPSDN